MNPSSTLVGLWAAFLMFLSLLVPTPAAAQRGDDGDYQILHARYGTSSRNVDVTQRLKYLASRDRTFRVGNDTMGTDPAPGDTKVLRIFARGPGGNTRTFEYGEYKTVDGNLFTGWSGGNWGQGGWGGGWGESSRGGSDNESYGYGGGRGSGRLHIVHASYGTDDRQRDVTYQVRSRVSGDRIDVRADNDLADTDPAPGARKTLWVTYIVGGGREQHVRIDEDQRLRLP
jgi:hypothetical protein